MAIDKVKDYFKKYNIENKILEFDTSSATVSEAARALIQRKQGLLRHYLLK